MLEGARLFGINQIIYASTNGTFGLDLEGLTVIDDRTLQRPFTMCKCGNLFGELLGRYYNRNYRIDFRSIRLLSVVGPGAKTRNVSIYNSWAIEKSLFKELYQFYVTPETACPIIYYEDAARAFLEMSRTPIDQIRTMNYIITGIELVPTALELKNSILYYLPEAKLSFSPDPFAVTFYKICQGLRWDQTPAIQEWNWKIKYNLNGNIEDILNELKENTLYYV